MIRTKYLRENTMTGPISWMTMLTALCLNIAPKARQAWIKSLSEKPYIKPTL